MIRGAVRCKMKSQSNPEQSLVQQCSVQPVVQRVEQRGVVFNKWTETVVVDLEMAGVDCAECLVLMWPIVISARSLSETLTDSF